MKSLTRIRTATTLPMLLAASMWAQGQSNSSIPPPYQQWLREDVGGIITDPEVSAFKMLKRDEERDNFIEAFWRRRDPTRETEENEFKDEHYSRIVYANERFSSSVPGWRTDRGRIYILFGPPDAISKETVTSPTRSDKPASVSPVEFWRYRYLGGFGQEVDFRFLDDCNCGEFHLVRVPERDQNEDNAIIDHLSPGPQNPQVRFKDLEEVVTSKVRYNVLPFAVRTNALRATHFSDWLSLTIQMQEKNLVANEDKKERSSIHLQVFARIITPHGKIAATIEEEIRRPPEQKAATAENIQFSRFAPLQPGDYRLSVVVYDVNADRMGTLYEKISLPAFPKGQLEASPIVVADAIDAAKPPRGRLAGAYFDVGDTRIHLRFPKSGSLNPTFERAEQPEFFMQAYGLASNPQDRKSYASIIWDFTRNDSGATVRRIQETNSELQQFGEEITLRKSIPLTDFKPGSYQLRVTITDQVAHQSTVQSTPIVVE